MKSYLKIPVSVTADDTLIQELIDSCTRYGEQHTRRSFRVQSFRLLINDFEDCITLRRNPIDAVTSVKYLVSGVLVTVPASSYYLKQLTQVGQILLKDGQSWPTNKDTIDHGVEIQFTTAAYNRTDSIAVAIKRHVTARYMNRGDCRDAELWPLYDGFSVARV